MKFWTITPGKYMTDALQTSDTTLVLAHLIKKNNAYYKDCKKFKKVGGKICLDNGFYEHMKNPPIKELISKAKMIEADILVLPDLPYSKNLKEQIRRNIFKIRAAGYKGELMMCVWAQGKDWNEDLKMFKLLTTFKELNYIAIPYCFGSREKDKYHRVHFLDLIEESIFLIDVKQKIHLFGTPDWYLIKKERRHWINSIDGSMPWKCGYYNLSLPLIKSKEPSRPKDYFKINIITKSQRNMIDYNLLRIKKEVEKNES